MSRALAMSIAAMLVACGKTAASDPSTPTTCDDAGSIVALDARANDEGTEPDTFDAAKDAGTPTKPIADHCPPLIVTPTPPLTTTMGAGTFSHPHVVTLPSGRVFAQSGDGWNAAVYDPVRETWQTAAPIDIAVTGSHAPSSLAWLHDEVVMLVGDGCHADKHCLVEAAYAVRAYDVDALRWTALATVPNGAIPQNLVRLNDGRILASYRAGEWYLYDPTADRWTQLSTIATHQDAPMVALLLDGRVLIAGGDALVGGKSGATSHVEIFDPKTLTSSTATPMGTPRSGATMVRLLDGRVLVAGGRRFYDASPGTADVEIYDPAIDAWSFVAPLPRARYAQTATLLGCGDVLVVGGWDEEGFIFPPTLTPNHPMAEAYAYAPSKDTWTLLPLSIERARAAVTTLVDGSALVVGGEDTDEAATSAERVR